MSDFINFTKYKNKHTKLIDDNQFIKANVLKCSYFPSEIDIKFFIK